MRQNGGLSNLNVTKFRCFEGSGMTQQQYEAAYARPYKLSNCCISSCLGPERHK